MPVPFPRTTILGQTVGRKPGVAFGIHQPDRLSHMFILGQTGTGKSTLLHKMMRQDIAEGRGFCLIDPHGDLAEELKPHLPNDAIYWEPANPDCVYGYNPLGYAPEQFRPIVCSALIEAFKHQWADAWGVRMEHLLRFSILALLSHRGSSLADIVPMFTDKAFRRQVLQSVTDSEVMKFWTKEFPKMNYRTANDGVAPIANKIGAILANPLVRKCLCDPDKSIRFRYAMDNGQPIIINLSKGQLGSDTSNVLGGILLSMIGAAAMTRAAQSKHQRRPFFVYADEFHNFTTNSTAGMLAELRKFGVGLIFAGQFLSQIKEKVLDALLGNVGTLIVLRVGARDAPLMARQLGDIHPRDLIGLPNYRMFVRMMINGVATKAFSARTIA